MVSPWVSRVVAGYGADGAPHGYYAPMAIAMNGLWVASC